MRKAFEGASAVATISEWLIGDRRYKQIKNALDVAKQMDLVHFCYTSGAGTGVKAERFVEVFSNHTRRDGHPWSPKLRADPPLLPTLADFNATGEVNYVRTCSMGSNNDESIDKSSSSNGDWSSIDRKRRPT
ncbi:hypothetical protein PR003_g14551 [Phytophthora rubi]|uniref:Uncharacterized protein n=1 Tax=Phytophthora rubi TaxID=129364 RepID=A0A6A4EUF4_9STRA|nr:hypothetical protein PR003_g14551 [Phytophthora rubi]